MAAHFTHKDSATYGLFVLVVGTILVPCLSAPTCLDNPDLSAADSWWYNACSPHTTRHNDISKLEAAAANCTESDAKTTKTVRRHTKQQMNHFNKFYKDEMNRIKKIYKAVTSLPSDKLLPFSWLPKPDLVKPNTKLEEVLVPFHENLQRYAVAIYQLEHLELRTEHQFPTKERKCLLQGINNQMRMLLCEIETAVNLTCQTVPHRYPPSYPHGDTDITKPSDLTRLLVQDWSVLSRLRDFIRISHRTFNRILSNKNDRLDEENGAWTDSSLADGSGEEP